MSRETDIAWAAGIYEGEGSIEFRKRKDGLAPTALRVCMTDRDVVERFWKVVGVGNFQAKKKNYGPTHKQQWQVTITGQENIALVLRLVYPYLGIRRKKSADLALNWRKRKNQHL